MAKSKTSGGSVPNRPLYSRISFLYQAATYLGTHNTHDSQRSQTITTQPAANDAPKLEGKLEGHQHHSTSHARQSLSRRFLSDLRATSLKSQIRLSPAMKHTICKLCDSLLMEGETSSCTVENSSKGGKKPWADVLVVRCATCGGVRRYPVHAARQKRRPARQQEATESVEQKKQQAAESRDEKTDTAMAEG